MPTIQDFQSWPDAHGRFGDFGGQFVAETLMAPLACKQRLLKRFFQYP